MTELAKSLPESDKTTIAHAADLLTHYSFDLGQQTVSHLTATWLKDFPAGWVRCAVIEALYQGRYKAISVNQILLLWKRRKQPCYHFNYEFERLVCNKFPKNLNPKAAGVREIKPKVPVKPTPVQDVGHEAVPALNAIEQEPVPAWVALAEQIQRDASSDRPQDPTPTGHNRVLSPEVRDLIASPSEAAIAPLREPFLNSVATIQTGVEAAIDPANTHLNASAEANKSSPPEDHGSSEANEQVEETQPPIHQFTPTHPASDFYTKLKAVAEYGSEEAS